MTSDIYIPAFLQKCPGVVAFLDRKDIPGPNTFFPPNFYPFSAMNVPEELFCSGKVQYYYQPVGLIVAVSEDVAQKAAKLVKIEYHAGPKPYLTIRDILNSNATDRIHHENTQHATGKGMLVVCACVLQLLSIRVRNNLASYLKLTTNYSQ